MHMFSRKSRIALLLSLLLTGTAIFGPQAYADEKTPDLSGVADASQMTTVEDVTEEGMVPVPAESLTDGDYPVEVESSSSMFRIEKAVLHVQDGSMEATLTMSGKSYLYVYPGSAEEAAAAEEGSLIPFTEDKEGMHCFTIPVEALDTPVPCAAYSKNKELWYARTLLFRADSLPMEAFREGFFTTAESLGLEDGDYEAAVALTGGSGKASVSSPAALTVKDGSCEALITWGSKNYDYMKVDGEKYLPVNSEGNSQFRIPVAYFDRPIIVIADTVAMSEPHEITYRLTFESAGLKPPGSPKGSLSLQYAEQFRVEDAGEGASVLTLGEQEQFLLLRKDAAVPEEYADLPVIQVPVSRVYLASSSVADLFLQLDALDCVRCTATAAENWEIPEVKAAVEEERILYAGKYSAPDYELLLEEDCDLVIENTMILHSPETREKLESLGFPVMLEYSSYEPHPLGRVEWIKLYGLLTGRLPEAEEFFQKQVEMLESTDQEESSGKTVAFFHLSANGGVVVRKQADYVTRMIELAGGVNAVTNLPGDENALSTVTIQMESFFSQARDADVLVYNSTVAGEIGTMEEFLKLSPLLKEFKAVKEGNVWCTEQSMFQRSSAAAEMIADFHEILSDNPREDALRHLHRLP